MPRIALDTDVHPMSDFRSNFAKYLNQVHQTRRPMVVTQHGRSSAVLLDVTEYERMMDKLELIDDIELATRQLDEGKGIANKQVRERFKGRISV